MAVGKRARKAWQAAELEPITLHECRHVVASLLIGSGANPKAVQEFMGHSKIQTTFDVYGHLSPGCHDQVRARMDAYLAAGEVHGDVLTGAPTGAHQPKTRPTISPPSPSKLLKQAKTEPPHTWRGGPGYREERYVSVGGRSAFARRREPR